MQTWQSRLNERKQQFLNKTRDKVAEVLPLLDSLVANRNDVEALTKVNKFFHQLAGAGGIYEMTEFCNVAIAGEELCTKLLMHSSPVGQMEQAKLRTFCDALLRQIDVELQKPTVTAAPADTAGGVAPHTRKVDVLLVDSNNDRLLSWQRIFEENKLSVRTVKTASGARGALLIRVPDAFVVNAPVADSALALEAIQQLRILPGGDSTVVLVISESASFKDKIDAIKCGADAFLEGQNSAIDVRSKLQEMVASRAPRQFKILSVEDDPEQAFFIKATLESAGYVVLHIADPADFEEALTSFAPDLVLLDIMLGDITGHDLARFVRHHDTFAKLPIVFLTTENQMEMHLESAKVGGDEHLIKPVAPQLLIATIAGRLDRA